MNRTRLLTTLIVVAALGGLIYLQVREWQQFDWSKVWRERPAPAPLLAATALIYLSYALRALRWKIFLRPLVKTRTARLIAPTMIGFTGLALLGRPGEFARPYVIARKEHVSIESQIAVWTVERIFDMGAFVVLLNLALFRPGSLTGVPYVSEFRKAAGFLVLIVVALAVFAYTLKTRGPKVAGFFHGLCVRFSPRVARVVDEKVRAFGEGFDTIKDLRSLVQLVAISLALWYAIALAYLQVMHGYPPNSQLSHLNASHAFLPMAGSMAGSILQLPVIGGGTQLAVITVLHTVLQVPRETAVSCGIVLWFISFMAVVPVGLVLARFEHVSLRKASREGHAPEMQAGSAAPAPERL